MGKGGYYKTGVHRWIDVDPNGAGGDDEFCAQLCWAIDNRPTWAGLVYVITDGPSDCARCALIDTVIRANVPNWQRGLRVVDFTLLWAILNQK